VVCVLVKCACARSCGVCSGCRSDELLMCVHVCMCVAFVDVVDICVCCG